MDSPVISQKSPYLIEVKAGKAYFWCQCGKSNSQPFCDGSHKGSPFSPVKFVSDKDKKVFFCGCKHSKLKPMCDGSHKNLT